MIMSLFTLFLPLHEFVLLVITTFNQAPGEIGPSLAREHEAEIHGVDASNHRTEIAGGDMAPVAEVTENQGQNGAFTADPGLMGDFIAEEMDQDLMSKSVGRAHSGSKIVGSAKAKSFESGEKTCNQEQSTHPSLSCNEV
ncbi:IAP-like protein 1 [Artemisia annua]|uniref:IAP-like protein 1 n=1 Tax=Artemisia annua TaxID=35608 RepID=A0A2U1L6P5_ARTAN|nr:IAP-like protein 1 [Artemisia annua]